MKNILNVILLRTTNGSERMLRRIFCSSKNNSAKFSFAKASQESRRSQTRKEFGEGGPYHRSISKAKQNKSITLMLFLALLCVGLWLSRNRVVWNDEVYTQVATINARSYTDILLGRITEGTISPLFYLMQKMTCDLLHYKTPVQWLSDKGYDDPPSRITLRLNSIVFMSLSICAIFYFFSSLCSLQVGFYSLLVSLSSYMVWAFWAEGRPYALWFFMSTAQALFYLHIIGKDKVSESDWNGLIATHLLLSLTSALGIIQIAAVSSLLWLLKDRNWKRHILLTVVPAAICVYYYLQAPQYQFWFADGPIELISASIPKDRFVLILLFFIFVVLYLFLGKKSVFSFLEIPGFKATQKEKSTASLIPGNTKEGGYRRDFMKEGLSFLLVTMLFLAATVLILLKFKLAHNSSRVGFQISSRYFIYLTPVGIIATTLFSVGMFRALRGKITFQVMLIVLIGILLLMRCERTFQLVRGYYKF